MLSPYSHNIQESLKHAWHLGIGFLRGLAAKVLNRLEHFESHALPAELETSIAKA